MTPTDRQRGCLLGLAIGDALGAAVEFKPPGTFEPVTGYRAGGPHCLEAGEWTDDTSMALALADSIARAGWNLNDQARHWLDCLPRPGIAAAGAPVDRVLAGGTGRCAAMAFGTLLQDAGETGASEPAAGVRTYLAVVVLDDPQRQLRSGLKGRAKIETAPQTLLARTVRWLRQTF